MLSSFAVFWRLAIFCCQFYHAMHWCIARYAHVVRPSVRLSVTLVDQDHIGWKSWKLISQTISPTPSLFVAQKPSTYSQGNMGKFWGDYAHVFRLEIV